MDVFHFDRRFRMCAPRGVERRSAVTGRRGMAQRPDADRSATSQAEPGQEILTGEDSKRPFGRTTPGRYDKICQRSGDRDDCRHNTTFHQCGGRARHGRGREHVVAFGQRAVEKMRMVDVDSELTAHRGQQNMRGVRGVSLGMQHGGVADEGNQECHHRHDDQRPPPRQPDCVAQPHNAPSAAARTYAGSQAACPQTDWLATDNPPITRGHGTRGITRQSHPFPDEPHTPTGYAPGAVLTTEAEQGPYWAFDLVSGWLTPQVPTAWSCRPCRCCRFAAPPVLAGIRVVCLEGAAQLGAEVLAGWPEPPNCVRRQAHRTGPGEPGAPSPRHAIPTRSP